VRDEVELPTLHPGKSIALVALGLGVYLIYLYHVGFSEIIDSLEEVDPLLFAVGFVLALMGVLFDGLAWKRVARKFDFQVSTRDVFSMYLSYIFLNNLIPSGSFSGETARIYFLEKLAGDSSLDRASATVAGTRIITSVPFFLGTILGLGYLVLNANIPAWALATCSSITLLMVFINVVFIGFCFSNTWLEGLICRIIDGLERLFHVNINRTTCVSVVRRFHESMKNLTDHRRTLLISTLWAFAAWLSMNLVAFVTFRSLGVNVPMGAIFAVYAVMIFLQMLPLVLPGGVGLVDIVMITLFNAVGVPMHIAVAATILSRLIQLWFLTILGGVATVYLLKKIDRKMLSKGNQGTRLQAA